MLKKLSVNLNDKEVKAFILNQIRELGCATALVVLKEFLSNIVKCAFVDITGVAIEGVILILIVKKIMELLHKELREQIGCQS
ncbi:hypothetical protein [Intestinicryptomonas porci]|uniref:Uncharacterized protein n=1 Tax=Intestinicryptomonas porci TaxID=2926320 RepID=A0ABU4WFC3_9BACT|nr:hypothetical protein [Opitutales bacterium CLA-KB-P66]